MRLILMDDVASAVEAFDLFPRKKRRLIGIARVLFQKTVRRESSTRLAAQV